MKLQMHSVHFVADQKLLDFIQVKLNKLDQFYDRITSGEVYLRLDKGESSKIQQKCLEVKLFVPGSSLFVKECASTFEEATDMALEALKTQTKKFKAKGQEKNVPKPLVEVEEEY
jgi:putative sigma-54 modulation protein